jgi:hypothetical protein
MDTHQAAESVPLDFFIEDITQYRIANKFIEIFQIEHLQLLSDFNCLLFYTEVADCRNSYIMR